MTLADLLRDARRALAGTDTPDLDARLLVEHATGASLTEQRLHGERAVSANMAAALAAGLARRLAGEPVHRVLGWRDFYGLRLALSTATLEPRPDTETLVDAMLPVVREMVARTGACRILDLGTGTGAIALALLREVPGSTATGVDIDPAAVAVARENATRNGLAGRFSGLSGDWFQTVTGVWDVIVSNPPYIRRDAIAGLDATVRDFDPLAALDGGPDGLDAYRAIAVGSQGRLAAEGRLGVEIGFDQREAVAGIFAANGYVCREARRDLGGRDRVLVFAAIP